MKPLEEWVHRYPRTCAYLVVMTTLNFVMNLVEALR